MVTIGEGSPYHKVRTFMPQSSSRPVDQIGKTDTALAAVVAGRLGVDDEEFACAVTTGIDAG